MSPFQPAGEQARWKTLYARLLTMSVGDTLTYAQMAELLDLHPRNDRHTLQMSMRRAAKEYLEEHSRAVEADRGVGYVVVEPGEHLRLAKKHGTRARVQLEMAYSKIIHVDMTDMDAETRKAFEMVGMGFAHQLEINRRQEKTNKAFAKALETASTSVERTQDELEAVKDRMARLEAKLGGTPVQAEA